MTADPVHLAQFPLFAELDSAHLQAVSACLQPVEFSAGQVLFESGGAARSMFFVTAGEISLTQVNNSGERFQLEVCKAGSFFGEVSLFTGGGRSADAEVTADFAGFELQREDLIRFLEACPPAAFIFLDRMARRLQTSGELLRDTVTRDPTVAIEEQATRFERAADTLAAFSGSAGFVVIHGLLYGGWIVLNVALGRRGFDPFPFMLLAMVASTEAIFLSCFVLLSQNRQAAKDRIRSEIEYEVNLAAERQIQQLNRKIDLLREEVFWTKRGTP